MVYSRLWWCRKIFTFVAILVWVYFAYKFKDLNKINNELLEQIKKQNSDLKNLLQRPESSVALDRRLDDNERGASYFREKQKNVYNITSSLGHEKCNSSTGYESDTDLSSDRDTEASDRTFLYNGDLDDSDRQSCSSFFTSTSYGDRLSRESTPVLEAELRDIRAATPLREMTPIPGVTVADTSFSTSKATSMSFGRKRGRPPGSGRKSIHSGLSEGPMNTYNLRSRRGLTTATENPLIHRESAEDFSKVVRHLSSVANRNTTKVNATVNRQGVPKLFSSDED